MFIGAPYIAQFYRMPELTLVTRVIMLNLIFSSFAAVPKTILTIRIDFKSQSKISLISAIISGIVGITMAYKGLGVWALVVQSLLNASLTVLLFFYYINWRPLKVFQKNRFRDFFFWIKTVIFKAYSRFIL